MGLDGNSSLWNSGAGGGPAISEFAINNPPNPTAVFSAITEIEVHTQDAFSANMYDWLDHLAADAHIIVRRYNVPHEFQVFHTLLVMLTAFRLVHKVHRDSQERKG
jgi:hypothetical protein